MLVCVDKWSNMITDLVPASCLRVCVCVCVCVCVFVCTLLQALLGIRCPACKALGGCRWRKADHHWHAIATLFLPATPGVVYSVCLSRVYSTAGWREPPYFLGGGMRGLVPQIIGEWPSVVTQRLILTTLGKQAQMLYSQLSGCFDWLD